MKPIKVENETNRVKSIKEVVMTLSQNEYSFKKSSYAINFNPTGDHLPKSICVKFKGDECHYIENFKDKEMKRISEISSERASDVIIREYLRYIEINNVYVNVSLKITRSRRR